MDQPRLAAEFSPCRRFRYTLTRIWSDAPVIAVIGLNPSTADETKDDQTIRRCTQLAKRDGYGGLVMLNLFAFRATDPADLIAAGWPVGEENLSRIISICHQSKRVVAAWGETGARCKSHVRSALLVSGIPLWCWGTTVHGAPRHPSRSKRVWELVEYR
jgi:hypothetical protein